MCRLVVPCFFFVLLQPNRGAYQVGEEGWAGSNTNGLLDE